MSLISRWTQAISRTGRDGMALSRAVFGAAFPGMRAKNSSLNSLNNSMPDTIKSVLLKEARKEPFPNIVAVSMLKIEREFGLVRYWGLAEYLRQNRPLFSFSSKAPLSSSDSSVPSPNSTTAATANSGENGRSDGQPSSSAGARVAFMVTSSMKRDLIDGLGYPVSTVKTMTPQQASLVIYHNLSPDSYEEKISELEQEFAEEQERKVQQAWLEASEDQEKEGSDPSRASSATAASKNSGLANSDCHPSYSSNPTVENTSDTPLLLSSSSHNSQETESSQSPTLPQEMSVTEGDYFSASPSLENIYDEDLWYEVVEIKIRAETSETTEIRHGLYKDHEEALLGLDTRQNIQRRREIDTLKSEDDDHTEEIRFVLRTISEKDLQ